MAVIERLDPGILPAANKNKLYLDYISGTGAARAFYTHAPDAFASALRARRQRVYPRAELSRRLVEYNRALGAGEAALDNAAALADENTFCIVTGQQAGFLGGPAYTTFKIITAIRLARQLGAQLGVRFVPVFWLASEDHDFAEINHTYYMQRDGQVGRIRFEWTEEGRPIADLPVTDSVCEAYKEYMANLPSPDRAEQVRDLFAPQPKEDFCTWQARTWLRLFSERGLLVVEPHILRQPARDWMVSALRQRDEIGRRLDVVSAELEAAGYASLLDPAQNGSLFRFDEQGRRVRVEDTAAYEALVAAHPERYSTDAALRPLLADVIMPVVVSVLGPGEIAYQGMLKPLYELFDLVQPLLLPRQSFTIVAQSEVDALAEYNTSIEEILTGQLDVDLAYQNLVPASVQQRFAAARDGVEKSLAPLQSFLEEIDPSLSRTWEQTVFQSLRNLDKLESRAVKARLSRSGLSKQGLLALSSAIYPHEQLQERTFPLPHFVSRYGLAFIEQLFAAGALDDFSHRVLILEEQDDAS
ncbi:MAG: bacillithiol biosynthesis cysteine-adding enzyme BshC [Anaerolineae bacterium]|nr:bacillithiol biosynthesis cysteine-adding enzyme BshC [Anaerolineae bacterium]